MLKLENYYTMLYSCIVLYLTIYYLKYYICICNIIYMSSFPKVNIMREKLLLFCLLLPKWLAYRMWISKCKTSHLHVPSPIIPYVYNVLLTFIALLSLAIFLHLTHGAVILSWNSTNFPHISVSTRHFLICL